MNYGRFCRPCHCEFACRPQADPHKDSVVASLIAELADPSSQQVNSIAFSPNGKTLATGDFNDGRAAIFRQGFFGSVECC